MLALADKPEITLKKDAPLIPKIAWGKKVSPEFRSKVFAISARLAVEVDFLMAAMAFETGERFSATIQNPKSGATGLIQFMPKTAAALGTSIEALLQMSEVEQLEFVEKYFAPYTKKLAGLGDVYMAILWPKAIGKADDFALFEAPSKAYEQNAGLDLNKDGKVTHHEASAKVSQKLEKGRTAEFFG
jgi:hypothetical protein